MLECVNCEGFMGNWDLRLNEHSQISLILKVKNSLILEISASGFDTKAQVLTRTHAHCSQTLFDLQ